MAFHFPSNWFFSTFFPFNYYGPNHLLTSYPPFETFSHPIPMQYPQNEHLNHRQAQISILTTNTETRDSLLNEPQRIPTAQIQKSRQIKQKKKSRNVQKQLESAKKNCESNLVNQYLSYFSSYNNSCPLIVKALRKMKLERSLVERNVLEQAVIFFCKQISIVNSRKERKYVNKAFLENYYLESKLQDYMPDIMENVQRGGLLSRSEFCELFRRCSFHFFRTVSVSSVTSSAKLNPVSRPQHIKRRRLIVESLGKK